jgi:hypothetical protein
MAAGKITVSVVLVLATAGMSTACESRVDGVAEPARGAVALPAAATAPTRAAEPGTPPAGTTKAVTPPPSTVSVQPSRTRAPEVDPAGAVNAYYDAIDRGDFSTAWYLGGKNLPGNRDYPTYVAAFSGTARDTPTVTSVNGGTVYVDLSAEQTDGSVRTFSGYYTVSGGVIVGGHLARTA